MTLNEFHVRWTTLPDKPLRQGVPKTAVLLQVSIHDRISASLAASVLLATIVVLIMIAFWMEGQVRSPKFHQHGAISESLPGDLTAANILIAWHSPEKSEFPEMRTVVLSESLLPVADAVSSVWSRISGTAGDGGAGDGANNGEIRKIRPTTPEFAFPSEADRWRMQLVVANQAEYARMLDYFGIEIGAVHKLSNLIECASGLSHKTPTRTEKLRKDESRLFFISGQNRLRAWDQAMGRRAGMDVAGTLTGHFFPQSLRERLLALEHAALESAGRTLEEVRETRFGVRAAGEGFEHFVAEVIYVR